MARRRREPRSRKPAATRFASTLADEARPEKPTSEPAGNHRDVPGLSRAGQGDVDGTVVHARRALDLAGPDDHLARAGAAGFLGLAAWAAGDLADAIDSFSETVTSLHKAGNVTNGTTVVQAGMALALGRLPEARRLYERAMCATAEGIPGPVPSTTGDLHVGLADVLREQNDLEKPGSAVNLEVARKLGDRASLLENRHRWHTATAGLLQAQGDLDGAVAMLEQAEALYLPGFFPDVEPIPAAGEGPSRRAASSTRGTGQASTGGGD